MHEGYSNVQFNVHTGWRQKLVKQLLRMCNWIDGSRWYLAIKFDSSPVLSNADQRAIIIKGYDTMSKLARDTALSTLVEESMRANHPSLFQEKPAMQTCSHGLPLQVKCEQCSQEALGRPACYETYWIAGKSCRQPARRSQACDGCAYRVEGLES